MGQQFDSLNLDPLAATEVIGLTGMQDYELNNPKRFAQLRDVVSYLSEKKDLRRNVLNILSKSHGTDKLDAVWNYVELQKTKSNIVSKLDPQDFSKDIADEIESGHLTLDSIKRIKRDLVAKKKELENYKSEIQVVQKQFEKKITKAFDNLKLGQVEGTIKDLEKLNKQIANYE